MKLLYPQIWEVFQCPKLVLKVHHLSLEDAKLFKACIGAHKGKQKKCLIWMLIDGQPTRPNASRWSTVLGKRIRYYLGVTKSKFTDQYPRNVDLVIQQMENVFETVGGRISVKYYKYRMRVLMNNFRHKCRKLILDGKDRESSLTPK